MKVCKFLLTSCYSEKQILPTDKLIADINVNAVFTTGRNDVRVNSVYILPNGALYAFVMDSNNKLRVYESPDRKKFVCFELPKKHNHLMGIEQVFACGDKYVIALESKDGKQMAVYVLSTNGVLYPDICSAVDFNTGKL